MSKNAGPEAPSISIEGLPADLTAARMTTGEAAELLVLQRCCWVDEALANNTLDIAALHDSLEDVRRTIDDHLTIGVRLGDRLIASVQGRQRGRTWYIGRLMVAPDQRGRGIAAGLLRHVERQGAAATTGLELSTGARSFANLDFYERHGFRRIPGGPTGVVTLTKPAAVTAGTTQPSTSSPSTP